MTRTLAPQTPVLRTGEDPLEAYLAEIAVRLDGYIAPEEAQNAVSESAFWIERHARDLALGGTPYDQAVQEAIRKSGKPKAVARRLIEEQYESGVDSPLVNAIGRGTAFAGAVFGIANLAFLVFLQLRIYMPSGAPIRMPFSPAQVRSVFPPPLPFPEPTWQFAVTVGYPILAPIVLGWYCGKRIPANAARRIFKAMQPIVLSAFALGSLLLPNTDGLLYALFQLVFWVPAACLSATLSSSLLARKRLKTALRRRVEGAPARRILSGDNP